MGVEAGGGVVVVVVVVVFWFGAVGFSTRHVIRRGNVERCGKGVLTEDIRHSQALEMRGADREHAVVAKTGRVTVEAGGLDR